MKNSIKSIAISICLFFSINICAMNGQQGKSLAEVDFVESKKINEQEVTESIDVASLFNQGNKYFNENKYSMAAECYLKVAQQEKKSEYLEVWIRANAKLGDIYYYSKGLVSPNQQKVALLQNTELFESIATIISKYVSDNYQIAKEYYEKIATPDCDIKMFMSLWMYVNNNLGNIYYYGYGLDEPCYKKALECYEKVATPQVNYANIGLWMNSHLNIGNIYHYGYGLEKRDYKKAIEHYERIIKPEYKNENLYAWINANFNIGSIYYYSKESEKHDYKKTIEYFKRIVESECKNENLKIWMKANLYIGNIYNYDCGPEESSYIKAIECYKNICKMEFRDIDLSSWITANLYLGDIYCMGKGLAHPNYTVAIGYYKKITTDQIKDSNLTIWIAVNFKLSNIYLLMNNKKKSQKCLDKIAALELKNKNYLNRDLNNKQPISDGVKKNRKDIFEAMTVLDKEHIEVESKEKKKNLNN